jgi:trehalose 6-phosphate phosphatase
MAPHLFTCWNEISARIKGASTIALFLDFDGTLAPLHPRPEQVRLGTDMRCAIRSLRGNPRLRVCVISGRRRADVRERIRIAGIRYLGLYGWEDVSGVIVSSEIRQLLECLKLQFHMSGPMRGTWVEDKGVAITIHHAADASPRDIERLRETVVRETGRFAERFRIVAGARSWEIAPIEWKDKGGAVRRELASIERGALPIYLGDEPADEPAFGVLRGGITVRVGEPAPTRARYRLANVAQVRGCLERIHKETA